MILHENLYLLIYITKSLETYYFFFFRFYKSKLVDHDIVRARSDIYLWVLLLELIDCVKEFHFWHIVI